MTQEDAQNAATTLRKAGWNVEAQLSPLSHRGWELVAQPTDGGKLLYGFSHNDMKVLVLSGQVARL